MSWKFSNWGDSTTISLMDSTNYTFFLGMISSGGIPHKNNQDSMDYSPAARMSEVRCNAIARSNFCSLAHVFFVGSGKQFSRKR